MWIAVVDFRDLMDGSGYDYKAGDIYPRDGVKLDKARAQRLATPTIGRGALIKKVHRRSSKK